MNIVWKKPDESLAMTFLAIEIDPAFHAQELLEKGSIPENWTAVAYDYKSDFPAEPQDYWRWDGAKIVVPQNLAVTAFNDAIEEEIARIEQTYSMSRPMRDMMLASLTGAALLKVQDVDAQIVKLRARRK